MKDGVMTYSFFLQRVCYFPTSGVREMCNFDYHDGPFGSEGLNP